MFAAMIDECQPQAVPAAAARARCAAPRARRVGRVAAQGFTLVELLITLTVFAILVSLASPSFMTMIANNRAYGAQTELVASLALARSEAARRNVAVVVSATAPARGNEFGPGWMVWVDQNGDGSRQVDEAILRTHEPLAGAITLTGNGATQVRYTPMGTVSPAAAVTFNVCSTNASQRQDIVVPPNGSTDVSQSDIRGCP